MAVAVCYFDPGEAGGAIQRQPQGGWRWVVVAAIDEPGVAGAVLSQVVAFTPAGASIAAIGAAIAAAVKVAGADHGLNVTNVGLPALSFVVPA